MKPLDYSDVIGDKNCIISVCFADSVDLAMCKRKTKASLFSIAFSSSMLFKSLDHLNQMGAILNYSSIELNKNDGCDKEMEKFCLLSYSSSLNASKLPSRRSKLDLWKYKGIQIGLITSVFDMKKLPPDNEAFLGCLYRFTDMIGIKKAMVSRVITKSEESKIISNLVASDSFNSWAINGFMKDDDIWL